MILEEAIKNALSGNAILFLGSGASVGAINQNGESFPIGQELAERLYPSCTNLDQAADLFCEDKDAENKDGEQELITFLKNQFRAKTITPHQKQIPSVPWKRIYTTNYDNIVEKAYTECGKYVRSLVTDDSASNYLSTDETIYLHINGSVDKLNKQTLKGQFKLTDMSYNTSAFTANEWGKLFSGDLNTYPVVIFIGFSMSYDLDIRRIVSTINKEKCLFIMRSGESDTTIRTLSKYGTVECIGFDGFFDKVAEIEKDFEPDTTLYATSFSNFEKMDVTAAITAPNDTDVLRFYKTGKKTSSLYYKSDDGFKAILKRSLVESMVAEIEAGVEAIFIHSDIGNGKTEVVDQICNQLAAKYCIYKLKDNNETIPKEIEGLCASSEKKIIIIENFFNYYDVFGLFKLFNSNKNITFIFTARTSIFKSRYEQFSFEKTSVYDLNRLDAKEINELVRIFEEYGYYPKQKIGDNYSKYIQKNCDRKLQSVILSIFDNSVITNSLQFILDDINSLNQNSRNILLFMIVAKVMNLEVNFHEILDLLSAKSIDYDFEKSPSINELVDFKGIKTSIKSVTICTWILNHIDNCELIFNLLVEAAIQADIGSRVNRRYEKFLGNIISYKHLKFILSVLCDDNTRKLEIINNYYQKIKSLTYYREKYFFWLQYGISALELNDFDGASHHFNAALAKMDKSSIPFEINNQRARLKMEIMLTPGYHYSNTTFEEFIEINHWLTPTDAQEDDEFYCYKMSSSYYPRIFAKFFSLMTEEERRKIKEIAADNYNLCIKYMIKNRNDSFISNVSEFASVFEKLSNYNIECVEFRIDKISKSFASGKILKDGQELPGQIHVSKIKHGYVKNINDYLTVGQTVKAKILTYNKKYCVWDLACI